MFLLTWFASVVNWAWERRFAWSRIRIGVLLYGGLLVLVIVGGGSRLAFFSPRSQTVRVAGISGSLAVNTQAMQLIDHAFPTFLAGKATQADLETIRRATTMMNTDLLTQSQREASAGAKIVVWPECGAGILQGEFRPSTRSSETCLPGSVWRDCSP